MLIRILKTKNAASCKLGNKSKEYLAGQTEEIFDDLAQVFIKEGWGVKFEEKEIETAPENKAFIKAPENKVVKTSKSKTK
jgi:hypothetical protein